MKNMERDMMKKIGRNDLCPCGSGKKYKNCCGSVEAVRQREYEEAMRQREEEEKYKEIDKQDVKETVENWEKLGIMCNYFNHYIKNEYDRL